MRVVRSLMFVLGLLLPTQLQAGQPIEVGTVKWGRDHDAALNQSKKEGKPVFVLFQEVPGCAGCKSFGKEVLSDPELVRAIESSFVPLLVYNNQGGQDSVLLKKYGEPAWNYQVIRFLDAEGKDIIPRKDRVWDKRSLGKRMVEVLQKTGHSISGELSALSGVKVSSAETSAVKEAKIEHAAISQYCFWTGERVIGAIEGVKETEAGFLKGREVTLVKYDPEMVSIEKIHQIAAANNTGDQIFTDLKGYRKAPSHDQKRQIQGTRFAKIKMDNEQATKVNAWARSDSKKALAALTPEQRQQL